MDLMTKWELNLVTDKDSNKIHDNGYFGSYTIIKYKGKYNIAFCDDRDAICVLASDDWFDEIVSCKWDGDYRWNHDKPAIVRKGDKYNILQAPEGMMHKNSTKMKILSDVWFDEISPSWKYNEVIGYYLDARTGDVWVKVTQNGNIAEKDANGTLAIVKSYSRQQIISEWIEKGRKCIYRYGFAWKGAKAKYISKEEALAKFPTYYFGKGFYTLSWTTYDGSVVLVFNELSENDML